MVNLNPKISILDTNFRILILATTPGTDLSVLWLPNPDSDFTLKILKLFYPGFGPTPIQSPLKFLVKIYLFICF